MNLEYCVPRLRASSAPWRLSTAKEEMREVERALFTRDVAGWVARTGKMQEQA